MAEFINTIDLLGDDAAIDSIIQRTIPEFRDNRISKVRSHAFFGCSKLTALELPNITSVGEAAFGRSGLPNLTLPLVKTIPNSMCAWCTSLVTADLPAATYISAIAFENIGTFTALILRSETICGLQNTNAFVNTPIASGTGYIYVPAALVDSYKAATNWSAYAGQFRALEDYTVDGTATGKLDESEI